MGDYILMKSLLFIPLILTAALSANNDDLSWVDTQVDAIKPPRDGESTSNISRIKDPFIFLKKNSTQKESKSKKSPKAMIANKTKNTKSNSTSEKPVVFSKHSLSLGAIINSTAFINGKWFKLGESVNGYKITKIDKKTVTLVDGSKTKVLSTATENTKLKFKR